MQQFKTCIATLEKSLFKNITKLPKSMHQLEFHSTRTFRERIENMKTNIFRLTLSNEHKCVGLLFGDFREHYHFLFSSVKNCYFGIVGRNKYEVDSTKYFHRWHAHPRHPHIFTKLGRELIATSDGSNVVLQYGNIW